jgi:hypothetical protein
MRSTSIQIYARAAGVLFLLSMIGGFFGELYIPSRIVVSGNAAATANNIIESNSLFRLGFAAYLVEGICDIALSLVMYVLLRPVQKNLALLAAFFGLVSTAVFAVGELFYFGASLPLGGAEYLKSFSPDQLNALSLLSLRMYGLAAGIFMAFYGIASALRGYLIYRSGYLPRALGVVLMLAGLGFITRNFVFVLAPAYDSNIFLLPVFVAIVALTVWFLVKGVDVAKWEARAASVAAP